MNVTTTLDGTTARIRTHGEIDFDTLPLLRAAAAALPWQVSDLQWDLSETPFTDIAGLHLLYLYDDEQPAPPHDRDGTGQAAAVAAAQGGRYEPWCLRPVPSAA
ncbi:hypothetical protein [Streptomyces sp. NPDC093594]|uniref:hypothetical protein n=1 Tax=Streptomyces sp. NPDC093594 TaxID=3155305 RepID=UPI00344BDB6D